MVQIRGVPKQTGPRGGVAAGVTIVGIPECIAKLQGVDAVVRLNLGAAVAGMAIRMEADAKANVPVVSGDLQRGIQMAKVGPYGYEVTASSLDGGADKEYAGFVEFGWSGHPEPEHFMLKAYQSAREGLAADLAILAKAIEAL